MIKAIVVARDFSQFATYIRNRGLNRAEYGYWNWNHPEKAYSLEKREVKVLWLEGWSENNYKYDGQRIADGIKFLRLFTNHSDVGEGWIYGQGFSV